MKIRKAKVEDLDDILKIYAGAKKYMAENGNPTQWAHNGCLERGPLTGDIAEGILYVVTEDDNSEILAVYAYIQGEDPTYGKIDAGSWLNDEPYGTLHRLASSGKGQGLAAFIFDWALDQCPNLRGDTHSDNYIMQTISENYGFKQCGIIYLENGDPRIAYHVTKDMVCKAK